MSHQRYPSHDAAAKEPHSVSLKVLRLSRPSLVTQFPLQSPLSELSSASAGARQPLAPASLAYSPAPIHNNGDHPTATIADTNPAPFVLSPIVNLPPSFGSAYVGETFSCTLCASHDALNLLPPDQDELSPSDPARSIRDVRIKAEMKTPGAGAPVTQLELGPGVVSEKGVDLAPGETLQRIVDFDLKEEGNHVLAVTVSYYEATDVSGRTRTFRKLYQFICKASLIVRTKAGPLSVGREGQRRWVLEAQLENCGEDAMRLERVVMDLEEGLGYTDCNWEAAGTNRPLLHPGEAEQVCFVVEEKVGGDGRVQERAVEEDGRVVFGVLGIGWRGEMGNRGFLSTGRLGTRHIKPKVAV
ncbi:hypothetical protein B0T16DRAFT_462972 [Cercophora newfieldiana]|uniref:Trafficking protein particle complex subunit 13 n=1 Tax=Cercophora newfieldiana TaxID=92897 RepID=A0AA40CJ04_9PEZI|nr:hypothetical protein B0T16DRAFT_462972 [Cercophora newfieldiana]